MTKETKNTLVLVGVGLFVALPDLIPFLGDFIDASVVAWGMNYFRSQAALLYPNDHRFQDRYERPYFDDRRYDGRDIVSRHDEPIDVEVLNVRRRPQR
ncbi:MAG TPA: hypothetical protein VHC22_16270 [Pirellulales bacterium]|nr:hypothetical protein [Pirellulales bacterium]